MKKTRKKFINRLVLASAATSLLAILPATSSFAFSQLESEQKQNEVVEPHKPITKLEQSKQLQALSPSDQQQLSNQAAAQQQQVDGNGNIQIIGTTNKISIDQKQETTLQPLLIPQNLLAQLSVNPGYGNSHQIGLSDPFHQQHSNTNMSKRTRKKPKSSRTRRRKSTRKRRTKTRTRRTTKTQTYNTKTRVNTKRTSRFKQINKTTQENVHSKIYNMKKQIDTIKNEIDDILNEAPK